MLRRLIRGSIVSAVLWSPALAQPIPLGPEFQVNTYATSGQRYPAVAMDSSGNFVVAWESFGQDGSGNGVLGRRYDGAGAPLGGELQVNTSTTGYQYRPAAAMDSSGGFVVAWTGFYQDGSGSGVFGRRYDSTGAPLGGEFQVNTYTTSYQYWPAAAMNSSGSFVVAWTSRYQDGSGSGVFGRRYDSAGAPLGVEFQVNTYTTDYQGGPTLAMDSSGGFVVAWTSANQDGSGSGVFGQRYDSAGAPLGGEFQVNTYPTNDQRYPTVAIDSSGSLVVAWQSHGQDDSDSGVFGRRYDGAGAPLGGEFQVNTYTTGYQYRPAAAMDSTGSFVVAWQSFDQDGSGWGVFGRRYDSTGAPPGAEFQVNAYTTNHQRDAAVATDSSGNFVVAWNSNGQDGSGDGVFGQRYCPDLDADALCDAEDVIVTSPMGDGTLDCSDPRMNRPAIAWNPGNYEKFRVFIGTDPNFPKGTRVTSGDTLLSSTVWTPSRKKWRAACNKAQRANPSSPVLYVKVFGVDGDVPKSDPYRKTFSQVVQADVQP